MRPRAAMLLVALAMGAGVISPASSAAQVVRDTIPAADTLPAEPVRSDTIPARRDTIPAPLARAEMPGTIGVAEPNRWHWPQVQGTGAITLLDLVERIHGVTSFHTGWIASPMHAVHLGSAARVRVFLDGVELVPMDTRLGGVVDLHDIPLWALEEVSVERGADEIRVHARSWRVERTTTFTRTDFETGDENTNLYRAFVGRRWRNGVAIQGAVEQYGSSGPPGRGGGDQRTLLARPGWARGEWSADILVLDARRTIDAHPRLIGTGGMPRFRARRNTSYARVAYGDPEQGGWGQLMAVTRSFRPQAQPGVGEEAVPDTTRWDAQYIAAAGLTRGPLRFSATNRLHAFDAGTVNALEGRALLGLGTLSLGLRTERRGGGLSSVEEATAAVAPLPFLAFTGAVAHRSAGSDTQEEGSLITARAEGSVRLGGLWLSGGLVRRGEVRVPGLVVFDTTYVPAVDPEAVGVVAGVRGRLWREVRGSVWMVRWEEAGWYRPQLQVRSEIFVRTMWLSRFPRGNFEVFASVAHDHRSSALIPTSGPDEEGLGTDVVPPLDYLIARLEVRLIDAVLFWQQHLSITATPQFVPGYVPTRAISLFGVRWTFWN